LGLALAPLWALGQLAHHLLDFPPSDISYTGKAVDIFHCFVFCLIGNDIFCNTNVLILPIFFSSPLVRSKQNVSTKGWADPNVLLSSLAAQSLHLENIVFWVA